METATTEKQADKENSWIKKIGKGLLIFFLLTKYVNITNFKKNKDDDKTTYAAAFSVNVNSWLSD